MTDKPKAKRGFAAMSREKQLVIATKGGRMSHGGGRKPVCQHEDCWLNRQGTRHRLGERGCAK